MVVPVLYIDKYNFEDILDLPDDMYSVYHDYMWSKNKMYIDYYKNAVESKCGHYTIRENPGTG